MTKHKEHLEVGTNMVISVSVLGLAFELQKGRTSYIVDSHQFEFGPSQAQVDDSTQSSPLGLCTVINLGLAWLGPN